MKNIRFWNCYYFTGLPRADTNPIAHELLDRFGTISGVCDAPIEELTRTKGITQNVAILLKLIPQLSRHYINTQTSDKERIYVIPIRLCVLFLHSLSAGKTKW
ncbi:MAG: hypothetical protein ACLTE2_03775 [Eubacteriales bacterium]